MPMEEAIFTRYQDFLEYVASQLKPRKSYRVEAQISNGTPGPNGEVYDCSLVYNLYTSKTDKPIARCVISGARFDNRTELEEDRATIQPSFIETITDLALDYLGTDVSVKTKENRITIGRPNDSLRAFEEEEELIRDYFFPNEGLDTRLLRDGELL